ncbi:hypothetical protein CSUB01_09020 [Colletotrichum sublineola]|uniref:Uncharacterized protein n=1 Tax=Colletotrichum sublineola TaxID=1173701 RepID=A0A066WY00_COLSU|nr:hypothetical protein CSUB01_09020 [Colletotrichum sublineola]
MVHFTVLDKAKVFTKPDDVGDVEREPRRSVADVHHDRAVFFSVHRRCVPVVASIGPVLTHRPQHLSQTLRLGAQQRLQQVHVPRLEHWSYYSSPCLVGVTLLDHVAARKEPPRVAPESAGLFKVIDASEQDVPQALGACHH